MRKRELRSAPYRPWSVKKGRKRSKPSAVVRLRGEYRPEWSTLLNELERDALDYPSVRSIRNYNRKTLGPRRRNRRQERRRWEGETQNRKFPSMTTAFSRIPLPLNHRNVNVYRWKRRARFPFTYTGTRRRYYRAYTYVREGSNVYFGKYIFPTMTPATRPCERISFRKIFLFSFVSSPYTKYTHARQ